MTYRYRKQILALLLLLILTAGSTAFICMIVQSMGVGYTYNQEPPAQQQERNFTNYPGQSTKHTHGGHRLRCVGLRGTSVPCWYL